MSGCTLVLAMKTLTLKSPTPTMSMTTATAKLKPTAAAVVIAIANSKLAPTALTICRLDNRQRHPVQALLLLLRDSVVISLAAASVE
jgi:hypothetical protein